MKQQTYDILEVGKTNRFFIKGSDGQVMCVHNCGYGASANKFAELMVQQGLGEQAGMAESLISTYRSANYNIVNFWKKCDYALGAMLSGGEYVFGGENDDIFIASGLTVFHGVKIPTIKLPNGTYIFYQNLRQEVSEDGRLNYVYDQFKGRGFQPKRIWGSALAENLCIAKDTLVLTDSGWMKIQDITTDDMVHDGVEFVTHKGVVSKSIKPCVEVDGVYMTKDHEVLTDDGWKTAEKHLSEGEKSQLTRFDLTEVKQTRSFIYPLSDWVEEIIDGLVHIWNGSEPSEVQDEMEVYDILDCGKRNRFVVRGNNAYFVVHNCQALSFAVLKYQAININTHGVPINLNVHDEWASVVPREQAPVVCKIYYQCMKQTPYYLPDGLLDCEVDVGLNYADLKTIDIGAFV